MVSTEKTGGRSDALTKGNRAGNGSMLVRRPGCIDSRFAHQTGSLVHRRREPVVIGIATTGHASRDGSQELDTSPSRHSAHHRWFKRGIDAC